MGIKNYITNKVPLKKPYEEVSLKVKDYMKTDLPVFTIDQPLEEVIQTLTSQNCTGAAVVNSLKEVIGIISEGDCLKQLSTSRYHNLPISNDAVGEYMSKEVFTVDENMSIFDVASLFLSEKRRRFPVVSNNILVGVIEQTSLLKVIFSLYEKK